MSSILIHCTPQGLCSWDFHLDGAGRPGRTELRHFTETGTIFIDGRMFEVVKHGPGSVTWTLEDKGRILLTAKKENPFFRHFSITGQESAFELKASSPFGREMILRGGAGECAITPAHPFTRRATINGSCSDLTVACFAFWLSVVMWRRTSRSNSG